MSQNKTAPIIPRYHEVEHVPLWQRELAQAIRCPQQLLSSLGLPAEAGMNAAAERFALRVPRGFLRRMRYADRYDPLLLQVLPVAAECTQDPDFTADPLGEAAAMAQPGVLHKYPGRVLLTLTGSCAVHCRYCFRRHYPYADANPRGRQWPDTLAYIADHPDIREVILSGGDPLTLSDRQLAQQLDDLAALPHIKRLRLHSRLPIVLPERLTETFFHCLLDSRFQIVMVVHANHPNEIDDSVLQALKGLTQRGITTLNQAVLLRGINDRVETLACLSERLFEAGVLPYYLHQLDRVQGAAHFEVQDAQARALLTGLRQCLPGYLVPQLVREEAGATSKTPL